jgi:hypothetical protein
VWAEVVLKKKVD